MRSLLSEFGYDILHRSPILVDNESRSRWRNNRSTMKYVHRAYHWIHGHVGVTSRFLMSRGMRILPVSLHNPWVGTSSRGFVLCLGYDRRVSIIFLFVYLLCFVFVYLFCLGLGVCFLFGLSGGRPLLGIVIVPCLNVEPESDPYCFAPCPPRHHSTVSTKLRL